MARDFGPYNGGTIPGGPDRIPGGPNRVPDGGDLSAPSSTTLHGMGGRFVTNGFGYEWYNLVEFFNFPEAFGKALLEAIDRNMENLRTEIEAYAKDNAPWQNQTGDARRGLKAIYIKTNNRFEIDLGHTVYYGFFLENHNGGALPIIQPTLRRFAPRMAQITEPLRYDKTVGSFQ